MAKKTEKTKKIEEVGSLDQVLAQRRHVESDAKKELTDLVEGISRNNMRLEWMSPREIASHDMNWKNHPSLQREAYSQFLDDVGWAGALLFNEETSRLLDGHLRLSDALERNLEEVPVLVIKVDVDTERKILGLLDRIGSLYEERRAALSAIAKVTNIRSQLLQNILSGEQEEESDEFSDNGANLGGKPLPHGGISLVPGEEYNYVVLIFRTELDFVSAQNHFGLKRVKCAFSSGIGIGRVVDGSKYLQAILPIANKGGYNSGLLEK